MRLLRTIACACFIALMIAPPLSSDWDYPIWIPRSANADPLYRFIKRRKAGYIDQTGRVVVPPVIPFLGGNGEDEFHDRARSKNWDEFAKPGSPDSHFVFTVCDNAAKEVCPLWPGQPMTAHWGVPDPAAVAGTPEQIERAFRDAFMILDRRISLLLCLPLSSLDKLAIKREIDRIGQQ